MPDRSPWYDRVASGGGSYHSPGYLIDVPQLITVHPLRDYPLVVGVNVSFQAALNSWHQQALIISVAVIGVAGGCTVLFAVIIGQFRRQEDQNVRLRQGEVKGLRGNVGRMVLGTDTDLQFLQDSHMPLMSLPIDAGNTSWNLADPAMDPNGWDAHMADLAARRPFRDFRVEIFQTDGRRHYISISGDPFFDDDGMFLGYHGTARDVTTDVELADELRSSKEHAEAASRAKSQFLTNMSHELRTPLRAIIGFSELIRAQAGGLINANYVAWSSDILAAGRHLLDLINDMLELSRIEAGRYDLSEANVDLASIVRACLG